MKKKNFARKNAVGFRKRMKRKYMFHPGRKIANQIHHFKRTYEWGTPIQSGTADVHTAFFFQLDQLPNYTEFVNLYDQYRVFSLIYHIIPSFNVNLLTVANTTQLVPVLYVHDYDDSNALTADADYYQYSNMKQRRAGSPFKVILYPKVASAVYQTALATGYEAKASKKVWIDIAQYQVKHYGLKVKFPKTFSTSDFTTYRVLVNVHFACKNAR